MAEVKRLQFAEGVTITAPTDLQAGVSIDFVWTADATEMDVDVSDYVPDARKVGWTLSRPSGDDYLQIGCEITKPDAATAHIEVEAALATGTYRLTGTY